MLFIRADIILFERLVTYTDVKGMPEQEDYAAADTVFSSIAAFLDRATGYGDSPALATVHGLHSYVVNQLLYK